ncbi:MAG: glycosyltransferase involved in cell wall biosynthesis, partial [Luteibaculaceae bacterium]
ALKLATILEEFLYRKSNGISGQTQGIVANIKARFPNKPYLWLPNGADLQFYNPELNHDLNDLPDVFKNGKKTFFYGGIIGHAQGLEIILDAAAGYKERTDVQFVLLGSGPEKEGLIHKAKEMGLDQVHFLDPVAKSHMPSILSTITASVIPLRRLDLFKGAIPSKIFEALAMEKPVLLGVEGEAKDLFVDQAQAALFFEPENSTALQEQMQLVLDAGPALDLRKTKGRAYVAQYFSRDAAADRLCTFFKKIHP